MSKFSNILKDLADQAKSKPQQTVCFRATFRYDRFPQNREPEEWLFDCYETMVMTYRQARKRRAIADRPTGMTYETLEVETAPKNYKVSICADECIVLNIEATSKEEAKAKAEQIADDFAGTTYPSEYNPDCVHREAWIDNITE